MRRGAVGQAEQVLADLLNAATAFVDWLATLDQGAVLLFTVLSTAVEMTFLLGLLVPGESVVMLAGSLPSGPAGFALVVALGTVGALSGQLLGYAVGRAMGARLRGTALGRKIGAERFDKAEAYLRDRGAPALVAVRFVAVIHSVVPIVAGTARMPFGRFLGWSALGTVLWVSAFAGVGVATAGASSGGVALVLTAFGATCLGAVPIGADARDGDVNRAIEATVTELSGHKTLYSDAYYDRETFDRLYGGETYRVVKKRYDPDHRLTGLYEKVVQRA